MPDAAPAPRVTKRRGQTRQRLLDAAFDTFAEEGFGHSTVEMICERAGYTRGAFYSNFTSLEELFLAMWHQRSARMIEDMAAALTAMPTDLSDLTGIADALLDVTPSDAKWYGITAEFTAHALRNPDLRAVMVAREQAIADAIMPLLETQIRRAGRVVRDPAALGQALIAVHDGTLVQCLMEPENPVVRRRRTDLFLTVVLAYTDEPARR